MTLYHSTGIIAASGGAAAKPGMVLLTPTSIAHSGTSASIGANGQVTFTAVTSLSLNGVFSATYDNYVISVRYIASLATNIEARLRVSGTDASAGNYTQQYIDVNNTTTGAGRQSNVTSFVAGFTGSSYYSGVQIQMYGPALAQPTAFRLVDVASQSGAYISSYAGTHSLSTAYDGLTLLVSGANTTGALQVYGVRS